MKTTHPSAFLPSNRTAVTPAFQSARFAGRKTGATGPHLLMARMRVHCARLFIVLALAVAVESARAQGTAFTYQGELTYNGALANGIFDLRFTVLNASSGGISFSGPVTRNAVVVSNGVFTVLLDFGAGVFTGADRWVEIDARANGGTFSTLAPRQPLTPAPYAITAANVVSGGIPTGTYASAVTFNNTSNSFNGAFTGNGGGLTGIPSNAIASGQVVKSLNGLNDAVTLSAGANITLTPSGNNNIQIAASGGAGGGWSLTGNAGTVAGANFIGTTDGQALELKVNGTRALRLEPNTNGAPNLIGGAPVNFVAPGRVGAVIAGGGATNYGGIVFINSVSGDFGTIGGGYNNTIQTNANRSTIGGGERNTIQTNAFDSTIGGGQGNTIQTNAFNSTIGGGAGNRIETGAIHSTIGGGEFNKVSGDQGTVPGGDHNVAGTDSFAAGHRAKATHTGSFVWADSMEADFATTDTNQFLIRASGGVGIGTNNPASALHVNGTARVEDDATLAANATIGGLFALSRVTVAPTAGSTLTPTSSYLVLDPASSVILNGTTAISSGSRIGTVLILEGTSDTQTVTIINGANTSLAAANRTLGNDDTLMLLWNGFQWIEISFSNN